MKTVVSRTEAMVNEKPWLTLASSISATDFSCRPQKHFELNLQKVLVYCVRVFCLCEIRFK